MRADPRALPAETVASARAALAAGPDFSPPPTRDSATVVLLRDAPPRGLEVYLLRRVATMAFAAGMYVFPGGSVDPRDADVDVAWVGPPPSAWTSVLSADEPLARALVCAAVRETFEESGILLAGPAGGPAAQTVDTAGPEWEDDRLSLLQRTMSLAELLDRRGLAVRADLLRPWSHWVTPETERRRYDTRFFVAALPSAQATRDVGGEADEVVWARPHLALDEQAAGAYRMLPPTAFTLAEIDEYRDVVSVLAAASDRRISRLLPRIVLVDEHARMLLPGDAGYDDPPEVQPRRRAARLHPRP